MAAGAIQHITLVGTGLIGSSIGLALRAQGFSGTIAGWDRDPAEVAVALRRGACDTIAADVVTSARGSDLILLATPVFGILEWMDRLAPGLRSGQLVTDVGSTKRQICEHAARLFTGSQPGGLLPGHPMAGKEVFGAAAADAELFRGAVWLFAPAIGAPNAGAVTEWREWVRRFGCRIVDVDPIRHDELCAWASHLPQMVATALAGVLEDTFGGSEELRGELRDVGGRAMRDMTRLGASPFSMWRDIAHSNAEPLAATLLALEQRLGHLRASLTQPELREAFERANQFRRIF